MKILFLIFGVLFYSSTYAAEKSIIELSLTLNEKGDSHLVDGSEVVSVFKKNGIFKKEPDSYDYSNYYTLQKDFDFFGAKLIVYDYEHMDTYLGCCVNPGSAVILIPKGDITQIEEFAKNNKCRIIKGEKIFHVPDDALHLGGVNLTKDALIELSCKGNDIVANDPRFQQHREKKVRIPLPPN